MTGAVLISPKNPSPSSFLKKWASAKTTAMVNPKDGINNKRSPKEVPINIKILDVMDIEAKNHKMPKAMASFVFSFQRAKQNKAPKNKNANKKKR